MEEKSRHKYLFIIDSSSWFEIENHPAQNRILSALVPLIEGGRVRFPPEVWEEIQDCTLIHWLEPYRLSLVESFRNEVEYLLLGGKVAHKFPGLAGIRGRRRKADPWVVAAAVHGSKNPHMRAVVCNETVRKRPNRKMPTACAAFGVECLSLLEMLHREYPDDGWIT
jgi:Domain of unknown function (DUF4411)